MASQIERGSASQVLAEFTAGIGFEDLPGSVIDHAKTALLNFLACTIAGVRDPAVVRATEAFAPLFGDARVSLIASSRRSDPVHAAYLNCLASSILAYDDTYRHSIVHPVGSVAAAALALCEAEGRSGRELLTAIVVGVEALCRASRAISSLPASGPIGWSQTGVCGAVGAATAMAHLMALDPVASAHAMAFGANSGAGLRVMNGTMGVLLAAAASSANGYRAALLAQAGVTGPADVFGEPHGFLALFSHESAPNYLTHELGRTFALLETDFKPYPCGIVAHAPIDACRALRARTAFAPEAVSAIKVYVPPSAIMLGDRPHPIDSSAASVSIQHWTGCVLAGSGFGPEALDARWIDDPLKRMLETRVRLVADDTLDRAAARIELDLQSGERLDEYVAAARGSAERPMTPQDVEVKFRGAAANRFSEDAITLILDACTHVDNIEDIRALTALLDGKGCV